MVNQKGQIILHVLRCLEGPATIAAITAHIANVIDEHPSTYRRQIEDVLEAGVRYGFIQCCNKKYSVAPCILDSRGQQGQLILQILRSGEQPAEMEKIIAKVAKVAGVPKFIARESIVETLNGGVRFGFLQRMNRKYYAIPIDLANYEFEPVEEYEKAAKMADKGRKRRKKKSGRQKSRAIRRKYKD